MLPRLIVIAKAPLPGRAKTRLCPPCTPPQAAALAEAALADTLDAAAAARCGGRVLALEGSPGRWLPAGFRVIPQRGDGLDQRLAAAFEDVGGAAVLIGMDTPQVSPHALSEAVATLDRPEVDAVLGPASDGGYWAIGMSAPDPAALLGVPMSTGGTFRDQVARLRERGLRVRLLPELRDVDRFEDARAVALGSEGIRFASVFAGLAPALGAG